MKFTLSWLREHLDTTASLDDLGRTLSVIGLELESITDRAAALAPFRIAKVVEATQHPNADRLRTAKVDAGLGQLVDVVCGAPNCRTGMTGVFAPAGSFIPGTGVTLKEGVIRGAPSNGMLLSIREMGLGDDHEGIVDLPDTAPVGQPYAPWAGLDDPVIEIGVTPNRGDALAVRGVARDLAAAGLGTLKPWTPRRVEARFASPVHWHIEAAEACPYVLGIALRGLRNGPSPEWLRRRLTAIGLRPINALVDVTNLFTFDLGRPLHVFDLGKVRGSHLTMAWGDGSSFRALNGKDVAPGPEDCVIRDEAGPEALGGIIGGEHTGCDEATTTAFVECAWFDPVRIALSGRRHDIRTDARARFERGTDPGIMADATHAAAALMLELCGGEGSELVSAGTSPLRARTATLRFERLRSLGGIDVASGRAEAILNALGFETRSLDAAQLTVAVPSWRNDVAAPIALELASGLAQDRALAARAGCEAVEAEADLVEEVARIVGLDTVPAVSMPPLSAVPRATLSPRQARSQVVRRVLAARGFQECVTFSFTAKADEALFGPAPEGLALANPIASDLDQLRSTPLTTLARAATRNAARGWSEVALAELGPGFESSAEAGQRLIAAGLRAGRTPRHWATASRGHDALDAKGDAVAVLEALGVNLAGVEATPDGAPGFYHPGRSGVLRQGPKLILGTFGELHPRVLEGLDHPGPMAAFEVFLDRIPEPKRRRKGAPELAPFQPLSRDFAFVVDEAVAAETVLRAARGAERTLITEAVLFDVYRGAGVEAGRKSLGVAVTIEPRERTLTDAEIEGVTGKVVAAVVKATGASLRG